MQNWVKILIITFIVVIYQGCSPFESSFDDSSNSFSQLNLKCSSDDKRNPKPQTIKRLSKLELHHTLIDLFEPYVTSDISNFITIVSEAIDIFPKNDVVESGAMDLADSGVSVNHLEEILNLSDRISNYFVTDNNGRALFGDCMMITTPAESCVRDFISSFGSRIFRKKMTEEDVDFYYQTFITNESGLKNLLSSLLSSPLFFYHIEIGEKDIVSDDINSQTISLTAYERINKLSYLFLQSMPDEELFKVAESGDIMRPEIVRAQVNRLLESPKVRQRLTRYFANQWLHLDEELEIRDNIASVNSEVGQLSVNETSENRINNMTNEVYDYFDYIIWEQKARYVDLMTSDLVFPKTADLAEIYGTNVWNGGYQLEDLVRAPANERSGLFTRAHFLFTGGPSTRPIMRGVEVYRNFLCGSLSLPADNSNPDGVVITDDMTDMEQVRAATEVPGTSCIGCHQSIINPIASTFQNYDAFGRFQFKERIYQPNTSDLMGQILIEKPVNSQSTIQIGQLFDANVQDAVDFSKKMATSAHARACFTSKVWNFAMKENLKFGSNPCAIQSMYERLTQSDGSIIEVFRNIVNQPEFFKRTIQ